MIDMNKLKICAEFWMFLKDRKKLIFLPLILILIFLSLFAFLAEVPVLTPFIYALF